MGRVSNSELARAAWCAALVLVSGCSSDGQQGDASAGTLDVPAPAATATPVPAVGTNVGAVAAAPMQPVPPATTGAAGAAALPPTVGDGTATDPATNPGDPAPGDTTTDPQVSGPAGPAGPQDGDPNAPVFAIPDVACGGPGGFFGAANFDIGGREMIVTYPCNKHAEAPMTFFLNLHGTTPVAQHFYQHGYFSAHTLAESHNLIVVTPSSVVQQWGNGDGGVDEPHLMEIIDWVYATFDGPGKFDIRAMWVGGHSWGAMYSSTFACKPELADKIKGAVIMSGTGRNLACAGSISVISSAAEDDIGPVIDQGTVPASHGCGAAQMNMVGNNQETYWPDCDPGFVHANYFMLGKTHTSSIDAVVVERIADLINLARP